MGENKLDSASQQRRIEEGTLVKLEPSIDTKVRMQDPEVGHLLDSGRGIREFELFSSGEFLLITTNNGLSELEVLS